MIFRLDQAKQSCRRPAQASKLEKPVRLSYNNIYTLFFKRNKISNSYLNFIYAAINFNIKTLKFKLYTYTNTGRKPALGLFPVPFFGFFAENFIQFCTYTRICVYQYIRVYVYT